MPQWTRWINVILGGWLVLSAFGWPDSTGSRVNTVIVGVLVIAVALWAMVRPGMRVTNTLLAAWLAFSSLVVPHVTSTTVANNLIVAVLVFIVSLLPGRPTAQPTTKSSVGHKPAPPGREHMLWPGPE